MKTKIFSLLSLAMMSLGMISCHEDITPGITTGDEQGTVNLRSMGVEINNAEKVIASSRAGVDLSNYLVAIYNSNGDSVAGWKYGDMPELFALPVADNYKVKVRSHVVKKAAWEEPYFVGEKTFSITSDSISQIGVVTCSLANVKVTVDFSDELKAVMGDDCKVTVNANDEGSLEFTKNETRAGYFEFVESSKTIVAVFSGTVNGNQESLTFTATDLEAGQYRKITFKMAGSDIEKPVESGTVTVSGISLVAEVTTSSLTGSASIEEDAMDDSDRPGQQDPATPDNGDNSGDNNNGDGDNDNDNNGSVAESVTFSCATASLTEPNDVTNYPSDDDGNPTVDVVVNIGAPAGIAHLVVEISSTSDQFVKSVGAFLPMTFDLAYPGEYSASFAGLGFPVGDQVIGATSLPFDISQFVPLLGADLFKGTHYFKITVTDNNNKQSSRTLTFVNK
jgi:hypothetical protein